MTQTPAPTIDTQASTVQRPRWPAWLRVAIAPVAFLAVVYSAMIPLLLFQTALSDSAPGVRLAIMLASHVLVVALSVGALRLMTGLLQRCSLKDIGILWSPRSLRLLGLGLAVSIAITVPVGLLLQGLGLLRESYQPSDGVPVWMEVGLALSMAFLLQGIPEEWFFRGWILRVMGNRPRRAIWTSALVFGVLHLTSAGGQENAVERVVYIAMAVGFGLSAGVLATVTRSVWAAIGVHAGIHVANIIGTALGMGQGPWLWGAMAVGHIVVGLSVMRARGLPDRVTLDR